MKNKIRAMRPLILLLLVFATLASCVVTAGAIGWSGSTTTGGVASSNAAGKYAISGGETAIQCLVGYRFAAIKADGTLANRFIESLDVFIKERESYLDGGVWARMVPQYSKKRYFNSFGSTSALAPTYILDAQSMTGVAGFVVKESEMGFYTKLPNRSTSNLGTEMDAWQSKDENLNIIAKALGYAKGLESMKTNDTITVEPLFSVKIDNENLCLTVAEMAYYGGQLFGWDNKGRNNGAGDGTDANFWGFIARFTNQEFGNALYNDEDLGLGWTIVTTGASARVSFRACIQYGYGVGICYKQEDIRPDLECVEIFFVDQDNKVYADPMKLPAGKTIYALAVYRNNSITTQNANFYAQLNSSSTALASSQMMYATGYRPYSELGMTYMTGDFMKAGTKISQSLSPGDTCTMVLMKITPNSSGSTGYVHAQTWLKGASSATTGAGETPTSSRPYLESNTANNYKKVQYEFVSNPLQDVGIEVLLTDAKGPFDGKIYTDTEMKKLPYGSVVQVWHKYYTKDADDYPSKVYVHGYDQNSQGIVKVNGDTKILITRGEYTYALVTAFRANSFSNVTRNGYVYLAGAGYGVTLGETNTGNNSDSITWAAKCDVELYQIIFQQLDANGNVVATWTRTQGKSETTPSIPYGAKVRIKYVYRNNSQDVLSVDGYKSQTISTANKFGSNYSINANKSTREVTYGTFTATASGRVYGAVRVSGYTGTGPETNADNNSLSFGYTVSQPKDLLVTKIRYVYKDANGNTVSQTVASGSTTVPLFPHGTVVSVYFTFQNSSAVDLYIDGYYTVGTSGTRVKINNSTNSAVNYKLPANTTKEFYVRNITTSGNLGTGTYVAEVFQTGTTSAAGETNTTNNKQTSTYKVYGDVGIEIYFTDKNNNIVDPAVFWQGAEYKVWLKVTNYTPFAQNVGVYYNGEIVGYDLNDNGAIDTTILNLGASGNTHATYSFVVDALTGSELEKALGHYSVKAEVYFYGSTTASGECDVNGNNKTANNTATKDYTIIAEVGITDIIYKDEDGNILNSSGILEGTKVKVYFVCTNDATVDVAVELLYNGENFADGTILPAKTTGTEIYITEFIAEDPSHTHEDIGEVYRLVSGISQPADGEENEDNNIKLSYYNVIFYDVAITDIFYQDADGNFYGRGNNDDVSLLVGKPYKVYYTLKNFSDEVVLTHVYTRKDPFATGATRITGRILRTPDGTTIDARNGLELSEFASISVHVGTILAANQEIGTGAVGGYIYICDAGFGYNDVPNTDIERNATNNALGEKIIFKHNVSIEEVYLTPLGSNQRFPVNSSDPRFVDIPVGTTANVHYVLKNHTGKAIKVNIYTGSTPKIQTVNHGNYVITLNPMETKEVVLDKTLTLNATGRRMLVGSVYRDGYSPNTDPYEMTFSDNTTNCYYNGVVTPYITPIKPNAPYREGTDVITSYYLFNPTNKDYTGRPGATAEVRLTVKLKGTTKVIYEENKFTVVPASCSTVDRAQLVYFKWSVPEDYLKDTDKFEVCADLVIPQYPDIGISYVSYSQDYINKDARFTPDTKYEAKQPDGWTKPTGSDTAYSESEEWYTWTYTAGYFYRNKYGIGINGGYTGIMPTSVTAFNQRGQYYMKSGYGVEIGYSTNYFMDFPSKTDNSYKTLLNDMYTLPQYAYMTWPEYQYSHEDGSISSLEWLEDVPVGDEWKLYEFMDYGRVHWTPIWFPDGDYIAYACYSDLWTPMGMITVRSQSNKIIIDGNMYDDWYIGHG